MKSFKILLSEKTETKNYLKKDRQIDKWDVGWLVVLGLTALLDSISVYIGPSLREREKEKRNDRRE